MVLKMEFIKNSKIKKDKVVPVPLVWSTDTPAPYEATEHDPKVHLVSLASPS